LVAAKIRLAEIYTEHKSEITEAFKLKYGEDEVDKEEKNVECT
jgi:hypothetical protein